MGVSHRERLCRGRESACWILMDTSAPRRILVVDLKDTMITAFQTEAMHRCHLRECTSWKEHGHGREEIGGAGGATGRVCGRNGVNELCCVSCHVSPP